MHSCHYDDIRVSSIAHGVKSGPRHGAAGKARFVVLSRAHTIRATSMATMRTDTRSRTYARTLYPRLHLQLLLRTSTRKTQRTHERTDKTLCGLRVLCGYWSTSKLNLRWSWSFLILARLCRSTKMQTGSCRVVTTPKRPTTTQVHAYLCTRTIMYARPTKHTLSDTCMYRSRWDRTSGRLF